MKLKNCLAMGLALTLLAGGGMGFHAEAATRAEIAQIKVNKSGNNFQYWQKDAKPLAALKEYVKDVTDKKSSNFIPIAERIAVFDMDGTLIGERSLTYTEWELYFDYLHKHPEKGSEDDLEIARTAERAVAKKTVTDELDALRAVSQSRVFAGLTSDEFSEVIKDFLQNPVYGMKNLKHGESFFLPMAEVVSYLTANDFKVYICSGADRDIVRATVDGVLPIPPEQMIGKDVDYYALQQKDLPAVDYTYARTGDLLLRDNKVLDNIKFCKVQHIAREIGRIPVLAFGNSTGDFAMYNYTLNNPKHRTMAFSLMCDDLERERGNMKVADSMKANCEKNGYVAVSMRDDWKTIYGYDVVKEE